MHFEVVGDITNVKTIAAEAGVRNITHLRERFGPGRWRKLKGVATVQLSDDSIRQAEVHWYEASGIGRRLMKIKLFLD